jgi:hypothetical protein
MHQCRYARPVPPSPALLPGAGPCCCCHCATLQRPVQTTVHHYPAATTLHTCASFAQATTIPLPLRHAAAAASAVLLDKILLPTAHVPVPPCTARCRSHLHCCQVQRRAACIGCHSAHGVADTGHRQGRACRKRTAGHAQTQCNKVQHSFILMMAPLAVWEPHSGANGRLIGVNVHHNRSGSSTYELAATAPMVSLMLGTASDAPASHSGVAVAHTN